MMESVDFLRDVSVFLYRGTGGTGGSRPKPLGTGFYTVVEQDGEKFTYLVTAGHVVRDGLAKGTAIHLRMNRVGGTGVEFVQLPKEGWVFHPDEGVDLAVQPHSGFAKQAVRLVTCEYAQLSLKRNVPDYKPQPGAEVFFVGLFPRLTGRQRNVPVFRGGRIALVTQEPIKGKDFGPMQGYVIECHFNKGISGAPLYQAVAYGRGMRTLLLGIVVSGYENEGLVVAVPSERLDEMLYGEKLMKQRKYEVEKRQ